MVVLKKIEHEQKNFWDIGAKNIHILSEGCFCHLGLVRAA